MNKAWIVIIFVPIYGFITLFGLGPVLLADGSDQERLFTLMIVLLIYVLLTVLFWLMLKRSKKR